MSKSVYGRVRILGNASFPKIGISGYFFGKVLELWDSFEISNASAAHHFQKWMSGSGHDDYAPALSSEEGLKFRFIS